MLSLCRCVVNQQGAVYLTTTMEKHEQKIRSGLADGPMWITQHAGFMFRNIYHIHFNVSEVCILELQ